MVMTTCAVCFCLDSLCIHSLHTAKWAICNPLHPSQSAAAYMLLLQASSVSESLIYGW